MPFCTHHIIREFTPKEASVISGVSPNLQRDWRRRGLLPEKRQEGWASFSLTDVIQLTVMKAFSDSSISVQSAREYSQNAVLATLQCIYEIPDAVAFEGDVLPNNIKELCIKRAVVGGGGEWLFAPLPPTSSEVIGMLRTDEFSAVNEAMIAQAAFHGLIINHRLLASIIFARADGPLVRIVVTEENAKA